MDEEAQKKRLTPDYRKIYEDLIQIKFPERWEELHSLLQKKSFSFFEVHHLNEQLFGNKNKEQLALTQKYKTYDKDTIFKILAYQKKHQLNNTQLAMHFKLSRNTVARWQKLFGEDLSRLTE